ncbi:hypothetical protein CDAR_170281 [Caerostris darwini]|uniref:Uncharacterized protein n=1 Tax=Caerostris darwini TaxID=1538125 RepID=A0AAV4UJC6_9ARAC|nr:hypothetical protein CDAR_170281 [Caerostris darwini]
MGRSRFLYCSASNNEQHPEAHSMLVERSSGYVKKSAMAECESSVTHTVETKKKKSAESSKTWHTQKHTENIRICLPQIPESYTIESECSAFVVQQNSLTSALWQRT